MKTIIKTLRLRLRKTPLVFLMFFSIMGSFAQQESKVWLTIDNEPDVPSVNQLGELTSTDSTFTSKIAYLNIKSVVKALPSSRNPMLQKVYEVTCDCDEADLYTTMINEVNVVSKVEYAPKYKPMATPNDHNLINSHYALDLIGATDAWNYTTGDPSITIAISDQNYEVTHSELDGQYIYYDSLNNGPTGHGTSVAIIAAGKTDNMTYKSSIGYNSSLGLYRMNYNEVLDASYAGAKVINLSWMSGCDFNIYQQMAIDEVYNNGSFIVASAGNGSSCGGPDSLVYPAAYNHVFSVTSIGQFDNHESTLGDTNSTHQHNESVDLCAPGYEVWISPSENWETQGSGTSFAAPFVSGTVALMLAVNPCLSNDDINHILKVTSVNVDGLNPNYIGLIGEGRLNAAAAVEMAAGYNVIYLNTNYSLSCGTYGGEIDVNVQGGMAPYIYEWSNGSTTSSLMDLAEGEYSLTVTDASGCSNDTTIVLGSYSPLVYQANIDHVTCNGISNGVIDLTIIEGNPDFTYEWEHGMLTEDIENLSAGTYRVTITDGNGCETFGSFNVMQPEELTAQITTVEFDEWNDIDLDLTVQGGTVPYNYSWNTGDDSEDLFDVSAGYYEATIVDYNGCQVVVDQIIEENPILSIESIEDMEINIYPNPTKDVATISWEDDQITMLTILNANGQLIESKEVSFQKSYQTNHLRSGLYIIILTDLNYNTYTGKLIAE